MAKPTVPVGIESPDAAVTSAVKVTVLGIFAGLLLELNEVAVERMGVVMAKRATNAFVT